MPGFDRTGPMGAGPMTGGARGRCNPAAASIPGAYAGGYGYGRGLAFRRGFRGGFDGGRGYGRGYGWYGPGADLRFAPAPVDEADALRAEADYLKQSLTAITARLDELEKKTAE